MRLNREGLLAMVAIGALLLPSAALGADTVSCEGKRAWQRKIVEGAVHGWFLAHPEPEALVHLVQAEHGIVACGSAPSPGRLHTTVLPRALALDQLGAVLLANELEWAGVLPPPEDGLAGEFFRVKPRPKPEGAAAVAEQ